MDNGRTWQNDTKEWFLLFPADISIIAPLHEVTRRVVIIGESKLYKTHIRRYSSSNMGRFCCFITSSERYIYLVLDRGQVDLEDLSDWWKWPWLVWRSGRAWGMVVCESRRDQVCAKSHRQPLFYSSYMPSWQQHHFQTLLLQKSNYIKAQNCGTWS